MASRGSALSRAVRFFREADIDEASYVLGRAQAIVSERKGATEPKRTVVRKPRKSKANSAEVTHGTDLSSV